VAPLQLPKMTKDLLLTYSRAALKNADELFTEASLLQGHGHSARAYFLAVACIEETGKALLAFDSQNRNLSDPAVCAKLKMTVENHGQKINYALCMWAMSEPNRRDAFHVALSLMIDLKRGREPAMYSDLRSGPDRAQTPREVVRATAAQDCIRLAGNSLSIAHLHVREKVPPKVTMAQDKLFTMKSSKLQDMLNTEDFWWYFISRIEAGQQDIAEAAIAFERDHIRTGNPSLSAD
jgi:AbiV family abortive infection protein